MSSSTTTKPKQSSAAFMTWNLDTRVIQRNLADGVIQPNEVKAFLDALPDVADKGEPFRTSRPGQSEEVDEDEGGNE